jgi:hypothetical protein
VGKAARLKRERSQAPATAPITVSERTILIASAALALAGALVVGVLLLTRPSHEPPPAAARSADEEASPALVRTADAVGFSPNVEPGTGEVERLPASAAKPPSHPNLLPVGTRAPGFTLQTPEGKTLRLADYSRQGRAGGVFRDVVSALRGRDAVGARAVRDAAFVEIRVAFRERRR